MDTSNPVPNWPEDLGLPLNNGFRHTIETASATAMTAGVSRVRRNIAVPVSEFSIQFVWTPEQIRRFRQFAHTELNGETGWFVIPVWSGGGIEPHTVRIKTANKYQLQKPYWSVAFVVECPERYLLPDWIGEELINWKSSDIEQAGKIAEQSLCLFSTAYKDWVNCTL